MEEGGYLAGLVAVVEAAVGEVVFSQEHGEQGAAGIVVSIRDALQLFVTIQGQGGCVLGVVGF